MSKKSIANNTALSKAEFKSQIEGLIRGVDAAQKSVEGSVQTQQKLIDEAKKQDAIGAFLNLSKVQLTPQGNINYAMYITLVYLGCGAVSSFTEASNKQHVMCQIGCRYAENPPKIL